MKEAKFTKGKWEVVEASEHHGFYVEDSSGYTVADLYFMSKFSGVSVDHGDNAKANANLIASAPEMYEFIETHMGGHPEAEALLAKARGES